MAAPRLGSTTTRILSGSVLALIALGCLLLGDWPFVAFVSVLLVIAEWEWVRLIAHAASEAQIQLAASLAAVFSGCALLVAGVTHVELGLGLLAPAHLMLWGLLSAARVEGAQRIAFGFALLTAVALTVLALRQADQGRHLWFLIAVITATDIAAYFVGRAVGGPKLAPDISPGKTWSGAVGAAVAAALAGSVVIAVTAALPLIAAVLGAILLSVLSQLGDLYESDLKRGAGVKDSGRLIPGHGGVLDRIDGYLISAPTLLCALLLTGEIG